MAIFFKKLKESDTCRYCKHVKAEGEDYICKYKGVVKASSVCRRYVFNPFAPRVPRVRSLDTTMFDPLDFKID
jgi:hypothetical protein